METNSDSISPVNHKKKFRLAPLLVLSLLSVLGGCSATTPPPETAAQKQVLARFDINTCQQMGPSIYKCPAMDKPTCSKDYNGPLECVRIGKNGGVYVASPEAD